MRRAVVTIQGVSPYSASRMHRTDFLSGESNEAYDLRTWPEKSNYDENGIVFVPAMAFKQSMDTAAKRLAIPDPDNRKANFTKYFVSDVICEGPMSIGIHKNKMPSITINANVDGIRGSGKRVPRTFPQTKNWGGKISFMILEDKITEEIFEKVLRCCGKSIGVGQFRPEKGGTNGRFHVAKVEYETIE